jgi:hypothetical protein
MTRPATVTQSLIARAMKVAKAQGMTVAIRPDGLIMIVPIPEDVAVQDEPVAPAKKWAL